MPNADQVACSKRSLRQELLAGRRGRSQPDRAAARTAIAGHLRARLLRCTVVCAYLPLPTEPLTTALLDELHAAGVQVLVPMVAPDAPLDWTRYPAPATIGPFGVAEPTGPRLGSSAVTRADVVLVPALAVDAAGHRLGRGGGHYDRTLALLAADGPRTAAHGPGTPAHGQGTATGGSPGPGTATGGPELIAVLFDGELVPSVPFDAHDMLVDAVVTPSRGLQRLTR